MEIAAPDEQHGERSSRATWWLTLGSLGVVYGDIGTSPLYALRESLLHAGGAPTRVEVIGIVSLLVWALFLVVTLKYVALLLRADNHGEGGTLSLVTLAQSTMKSPSNLVLALGIVGASLFYGDAILTPAISVLSAVEGLEYTTDIDESWIVPIVMGILIILYAVQSYGTAKVSAFFGPIMLVWFATLAILGIVHINDAPDILNALNPLYALSFMTGHGILGFTVLGSVFLAVTGAEALYADMGHFGRTAIRRAWLFFVLPGLVVNYLGQGALALSHPDTVGNLFFSTAPEWGRLPLVLLATAATVIAAQAVITGAYSLTHQATQLGILPRLAVSHTSEKERGQIYMPKVNWLMLAGALFLVVIFETSSNLAAAYGIAVVGTMIVSTMLAVPVIARLWGWGWIAAVAVALPFFLLDSAFLTANLLKLADGGWIPLALGFLIVIGMWTWVRGTRIVAEKVRRESVPLSNVVGSMAKSKSIVRVTGTAVFLTSDTEVAPAAMMHNLKHNKVLHEQNVLLTVVTEPRPYVPRENRSSYEKISDDFSRVVLRYGYMESPHIPRALDRCKQDGLSFEIMSTSFFIGRRTFKISPEGGAMPNWQDRLFILLTRQADDVITYFRIPAGRVIELGSQITL
ncbi:putative potassium transport system protein kup 1 [Terrihabitans soli]|uniref:Probable potassium transport system protein Kup n=1 Tax=Terrihabitans soli TaxID=708113 RepID=A0A6S6QV61_9HYPH|nr:putative potassium transport system protein kup 1 [Terrihabitans soli]